MKRLSERVKQARTKQGLTQAQAFSQIGLADVSTLSKLENGSHDERLDSLVARRALDWLNSLNQ